MTSIVHALTALGIAVQESDPPGLRIDLAGKTGTPGWSGFALDHHVYIAPPPNGVYEADLVGNPPPGHVIQVVTPFTHAETWKPFPDGLKGLKVNAATNSITVMLA